MNNPLPEGPDQPEGRLSVYATDDPVAASQLLAMLEDLGLTPLLLTRPDVYPGLWPQYPAAYQILVGEAEAEARRADIEAAIKDLESPPPPPEKEA